MNKNNINPMDIPEYREAKEKIDAALANVSDTKIKIALLISRVAEVATLDSKYDMDKAEVLIKNAAAAMLGAVHHAKKLKEVLQTIKDK